jgi:hypothetical protein
VTRSALLRASATFAVLCATGLGYAPAAHADTSAPTETVIPDAESSTPRGDLVVFAGTGGFLHHQQGQSHYVWTKYSGGDTPVSGMPHLNIGSAGAGGDVVATTSSTGSIQLQDMDSGTTTLVTPPAGDVYFGTFGSHVLTYTRATNASVGTLHILGSSNGQQTQISASGWPTGATVFTGASAGTADTVLVRYLVGSSTGLALVDLTSGQVTPVFSALPTAFGVVLTDRYVGWYSMGGAQTVLHLRDRSDLGAAETTVDVPAPALPSGAQAAVYRLAIAGDSLLVVHTVTYQGTPPASAALGPALYRMPLSGGPLTTLLDHVSPSSLHQAPDGALVVGGTSVDDWAARRLAAAPDGTLSSTSVSTDPPVLATVNSIALAKGHLDTVESFDPGIQEIYGRTVQWGGAPSYGARTDIAPTATTIDCSTVATCTPPIATEDGHIAQVAPNAPGGGPEVTLRNGSVTDLTMTPNTFSSAAGPTGTGGTLADADDHWAVYDGTNGLQYIGTNLVPNMAGGVYMARQTTAEALDGSYLWAAGSTPGALNLIDLYHVQTQQTIRTGANCVPTELQSAASRWIYWSCGTSGPAGVWDLATHQDIPVPSGLAQLGDGYVVTHDTTLGKLVLTDVHTGTPVTTDLANLPAGAVPDDRRAGWAVDKYGGGIAYLDAQNNIHLIDPHIPASTAQPSVGLSLRAGEQLTPGNEIASGNLTLVMQSDGNLVAYLQTGHYPYGPPLWASNTAGHPGAYALMQPDGNLVVYSASGGPSNGGALWSTGTFGHPGAYTAVQDDGNLVVYLPGGSAAWSTGTYAHPQNIAVGTVMKPGWWAQSALTRLVMQSDGDLVLYRKRDGATLWTSNTSGHPGAYAVMQPDGNLVIYRPGSAALWASNTSGRPGAYALLQDDGNFVVYRSGGGPTTGGALWSTGTYKNAQ